jgi:hypothetical protein
MTIYRLEDGKRSLNGTISLKDAKGIVKGLPADTHVFVSVLGTYHNILGLLRSGPDFDFFLDADDVVDRTARANVPHRAIADAFLNVFAEAKPVREISAASRGPVHLLSSPPPKADNEFIFSRLTRQKKRAYRGKVVCDVGVERPVSRLKLWRLETSLISSWAEAEGMSFVPPPSEAFDADGFLAEEFYGDDATHANARYGALVVKQISEIIRNRVPEAAHG